MNGRGCYDTPEQNVDILIKIGYSFDEILNETLLNFWLCAYVPDSNGESITSWDHDIDDEIEAMDSSIIDFLSSMKDEYEEDR